MHVTTIDDVAQDSIAMPATFDTVAACSSWKWRKRCHITMHGKIQNPRIHVGLSGICMYRLSMMCHRHGPQESPGTEVLKKRFLFADCYLLCLPDCVLPSAVFRTRQHSDAGNI